jgi:GT2 family glycosyltransferase/peptidoglycan/xylan/chitin deacetylase (PgdA/CDA1 family)
MARPQLSVVIATYNRRELLRRCLDALRLQTADPADFEVVVAVDGAADGTLEMLEGLKTPFQLRPLWLERGGRSQARNSGIRAARGTVCLFLDDDVIVETNVVAEHLAAHRDGQNVAAIGRITQEVPPRRDWYGHTFAKTWNRHYDGLTGKPPDWTACYGGNLSVPREALLAVGGFATELPTGEDIELGFRLQEHGCAPRYLPGANGLHVDQKSRKALLADTRRQGAGYVEFADRHPGTMPNLLGWFGAATPREILLRRLLLTLRMSPTALAMLGRAMPGEGRQQIWFDFVSRFAFWRAARTSMSRERWVRTTRGVPVLMYHAFGQGDEGDRYVVPRRALARQMRVLSLLRYRVIPFEELVRSLRDFRLPPPRALAITVDDGYRDNLEVMRPILEKHGFVATIFLVSERIGGVNDWTEGGALDGRPLLSSGDIAALAAAGTRFGAHTRTHCSLTEVDDDQVEAEVLGSREDLSRSLATAPATFAYPFGRVDDRAVAAVRSAGFLGACTVRPRLARLNDDPLQIPRVEVRAEDSLLRFVVKLWLGGR